MSEKEHSPDPKTLIGSSVEASEATEAPTETHSLVEASESQQPDVASAVETISYLGATLPIAERRGSYSPDPEAYSDFIEDDFSRELERKIATSWLNGDPILIEGGTSIGKTTTVKKMAAELGYEVYYINLNGLTDPEALMGRYIPNAHRHGMDEPEYIFADGPVTAGLRQEEGKIKVIILDECNSARPEVNIRLHEVLDAIERDGQVVLSEDAAEVVDTSRIQTKIIALTNPPGRGYLGREPMDPALMRRFVYQKEATLLPDETFTISAEAMFGLAETDPSEVEPEHHHLESRDEMMTPEQLAQIPGMAEIIGRYREFHRSAQKLVASRDIAADQPQTFTFDDRMELRRVRDYVARFYNGDITETMAAALEYYYIGKLESDKDRAKLAELARHVAYTPSSDSRRRDVVSTGGETIVDSPELAAIIERLDLHGQYTQQQDILSNVNIIDINSQIEDINGNEHKMPTYEQVVEMLERNAELVEAKAEQGFTKLLIVPFGMPLAELVKAYGGELTGQADSPAGLKSSDGTSLELDKSNPVWMSDLWHDGVDTKGGTVYYPERFDSTDHGGKTKSELITAGEAWQVILVEDLADIPAGGTGEELAGRQQLEAGNNPREYLETLWTEDQYTSESGLTPEAWLTLALTRLHESGQVLDDYGGEGKGDYLLGAYSPSSGYLPYGYWSRGHQRASLDDADPVYGAPDDGCRSAVRIS